MSDGTSRPAVRGLVAVLVGIVAGRLLGPLFVPDPTSTLAYVLTVVVGVATAGIVYAIGRPS